MSMTGKTTNELLPIGLGTDAVSIFDINTICEKIDNLINELQTKENVDASDIATLKQNVTTLTQSVTEATQTASTNASSILQLQTSVNSLTSALESYLKTSELSKKIVIGGSTSETFAVNKDATTQIEIDIAKNGYTVLGSVGVATSSGNLVVSKVEASGSTNKAYCKIKNVGSSNITDATIRVTALYLAK